MLFGDPPMTVTLRAHTSTMMRRKSASDLPSTSARRVGDGVRTAMKRGDDGDDESADEGDDTKPSKRRGGEEDARGEDDKRGGGVAGVDGDRMGDLRRRQRNLGPFLPGVSILTPSFL